MDTAYSLKIQASHLLYISELLVLQHMSTMESFGKVGNEIAIATALSRVGSTSTQLATLAVVANLAQDISEILRTILRQPLRDPRFRQQFNELFAQHPMVDKDTKIWLNELLTWEE